MFACADIHTHQRITVAGNDAFYSPPPSVLHAGLYSLLTIHLFTSKFMYVYTYGTAQFKLDTRMLRLACIHRFLQSHASTLAYVLRATRVFGNCTLIT